MKTILILLMFTVTFYSCRSEGESSDNTALIPTQVKAKKTNYDKVFDEKKDESCGSEEDLAKKLEEEAKSASLTGDGLSEPGCDVQ